MKATTTNPARDTYGIVSAARAELSPSQNEIRHANLAKWIDRLGLPRFETFGVWEGVSERGYLIPGATVSQCLAMGRFFRQDAILHASEGDASIWDCQSGRLDLVLPRYVDSPTSGNRTTMVHPDGSGTVFNWDS